jgi:hypothetical protein
VKNRGFNHPFTDVLLALSALFPVGEYEADDLYAHSEGEKYCPDPDIFRREKHQHGAKYE